MGLFSRESAEDKAALLGADGVIGVRLEIKVLERAENLAEFVAIGTAVVAMRADHMIPTPQLVLAVDG